jgi:hypothetical protein
MQTEPAKAEPPKRKRRWFQFSLQALMIFTLVCAVASAWLGRKIERKRRERETIREIISLGKRVCYDYQAEEDPSGPAWRNFGEPPGPSWVRKLLGENFFSEVEVIFFDVRTNPALNDAELEKLQDFSELRSLRAPGIKVTDAGLVNLKRMSKLRYLDLSRTSVTDAGVNDLKKVLPNCAIFR